MHHFVVFLKELLHFLGLSLSLVLKRTRRRQQGQKHVTTDGGGGGRRRRGTEGAHLLFDVNLRQALQLGAVFWYVCGRHRHTADKRPESRHIHPSAP